MAFDKKSPLILYLIILLGFVLGYVYSSQTDPTANVPPIDAKYQASSIKSLASLKIDFSILTKQQFQDLRVFGDYPVQPGTGGNSNPFQ